MNISIAGTGYVGLSIAVLLAQHNHVTAVDIIPEKIDMINRRQSPIQDEYIEKYLAEKELNVDLCCLVSTQEEVGMRGAGVAANAVGPDTAIVVDVTHAKTPDGPEAPCLCGKGAAIGLGPNMNPALSRQLRQIAEEKKIPYQLEAISGGRSGTDAFSVQIAREGVATALISLPMKYMHTPVEVVSRVDMQAVQALIEAYVEGLEG